MVVVKLDSLSIIDCRGRVEYTAEKIVLESTTTCNLLRLMLS